MLHLVAWAPPGRLLFRTWAEGLALWHIMVRAFPALDALAVMPHHLHVQGDWNDAETRLAHAESAYSRWRLHHREGRAGASAFASHPPPSPVADERHERRNLRYIHLNPVRDGLARCPLEWPLSTHRDRCGLAGSPVVSPEREPSRFHRYVATDNDSNPEGTPLPLLTRGNFTLDDIIDAASATCRVPPGMLRQRGEPRTLAIEAAWLHGLRDAGQLAVAFQLSPASVRRVTSGLPEDLWSRDLRAPLRAVLAAVGDRRFFRLDAGDLARTPWFAPLRGRI